MSGVGVDVASIPVVYCVRRSKNNEELRYSLRSLKNLPHGDVYMCGGPPWVRNVERLPYVEHGKWWSLHSTLKVASETFDRFLFFNDDFFIMQPRDEVPIMHRGPFVPVRPKGGGEYWTGAKKAHRWLTEHGYSEPLDYELHAPLLIDGAGMTKTLDMLDNMHPQGWLRTIYGNVCEIGGFQVDDFQYGFTTFRPDRPFLASREEQFSFAYVGDVVRERFPEPSEYE